MARYEFKSRGELYKMIGHLLDLQSQSEGLSLRVSQAYYANGGKVYILERET